MPSLLHRPALAPRDGISSFSSAQSSDSYYSNTEIRCLHDVVAIAQEHLDNLPEGERLPTNALFQAYDEILPTYGIDPEEDHHISRLVFRVGGERGNGSLLEKLHNVLSRMGIELEFDAPSEGSRPFSDYGDEPDNEVASQPSPSFSGAGHESVTEDEAFENVQLPQQGRYESSSVSFEANHSSQHPSSPRLTHAILGSNHLAPRPYQRLELPSRNHHAPGDTTFQSVGMTASHSAKNEKIASSLPVRTKPVRTVNWLLPEDADTEPVHKSRGTAVTKQRAQYQAHQQQYQPSQLSQQPLQYEHRILQQQNLPVEHSLSQTQPQQYQRYQHLEDLQHEQRVLLRQKPLQNHQLVDHQLPQPQQALLQPALPQQQAATETKLQQQQYQDYQQAQQSVQPPQISAIRQPVQQSELPQIRKDQQEQQLQLPHLQQQQSYAVNATSTIATDHEQNISAGRQQTAKGLFRSDVKDFGQEPSNDNHQPPPQPLVEKPSEPEPETHVRDVSADEEVVEDPEMEARYVWLERRATRAARYLQLLRGISHWETYAVEKRERTAVARRHILRMRHFDPWELVTADAKLKGRRIFTSRLLTLWIRRVDEYAWMDHQASAITQHHLAKRVIAAWSGSCPIPTVSSSLSRTISSYLQQWHVNTSSSEALFTHVEYLGKNLAIFQISNVWHQWTLRLHVHVAAFRRRSVIRNSLSHWQLETKVEVFRAKMGFELIRNALSRWLGTCRPLPSCGQAEIRTTRRRIDAQAGQLLTRLARGTNSPMAISHRMLKTKVLDIWYRQASTAARTRTRSRRFAAHQAAQKALDSWQVDVQHGRTLSTWSQRGHFYVSANAALKNWRSKGTWRSHTRKAYARCRQNVKATTSKRYLSRWKLSARVHGNIGWEATAYHNAIERNRFVLALNAWLSESINDWGSSRLLTNAWLGEWHVTSQDYDGIQSRSKGAWEETLKSRYWGQWQSTLLQLKSREYVAADVRERNKKKLVRRLLLHWKGDGDTGGSQQASAFRASLGASRRGAGIGSNRDSVQLSRAVYDRPGAASFRASRLQEFGPTVEEEYQDGEPAGVEADRVVVNTPTRWTGMASSVRLPSMTPFAPLPTPFERELRERYNKSMPPAPNGQLSKLSFAQAQRLSVAEVNARRTTNNIRQTTHDGRSEPKV